MSRLCRSWRLRRRLASVKSPSWIMSSTHSTDVGCMIRKEASSSGLCSWRSRAEREKLPRQKLIYIFISMLIFALWLPFHHRSLVAVGRMGSLWPALRWAPQYRSPPKPNHPVISDFKKIYGMYGMFKDHQYRVFIIGGVWYFLYTSLEYLVKLITRQTVTPGPRTMEWKHDLWFSFNILSPQSELQCSSDLPFPASPVYSLPLQRKATQKHSGLRPSGLTTFGFPQAVLNIFYAWCQYWWWK